MRFPVPPELGKPVLVSEQRAVATDRSAQSPVARDGPPRADESLASLLGGRAAAVDASLGPAVFALGWFVGGRSVLVGSVAAVTVCSLIVLYRWRTGGRPRAALLSLLATIGATAIVMLTGRAEDFFLVQLGANMASAVVWLVGIVLRWPLLGLVVGAALGQRTRWRRDPVLLKAYSRASWVWILQYSIRIVVFAVLWSSGAVVALGFARIALSWPLIAACLAVSWLVIRRVLAAAGHPGIRSIQPAR